MSWKSVGLKAVFAVLGVGLFGALPLVALNARDGQHRIPPIGQRAYVMEGDLYAPARIEKKSAAKPGVAILKDPVQPGKLAPLPPPKRAPVVAVKRPPMRPGQLRFAKLNVSGHLTQPRVEFTHDLLPVERADEPTSQDFFQKVFDPSKDDNF